VLDQAELDRFSRITGIEMPVDSGHLRLLRRVMQVSASAFYAWVSRGSPVVSEDDLDDACSAALPTHAM